jgi:hypothetical protein
VLCPVYRGEAVACGVLEPAQVLNIAFGGNLGELDFDREYPAVSLDD